MRFEAKNSYFKRLSHGMFNFKNFPKSLAFRHQKLQCYNLAEEGGYLRMFVEIGSGRVLYTSVDGFLQDTFLNYYIFNTCTFQIILF